MRDPLGDGLAAADSGEAAPAVEVEPYHTEHTEEGAEASPAADDQPAPSGATRLYTLTRSLTKHVTEAEERAVPERSLLEDWMRARRVGNNFLERQRKARKKEYDAQALSKEVKIELMEEVKQFREAVADVPKKRPEEAHVEDGSNRPLVGKPPVLETCPTSFSAEDQLQADDTDAAEDYDCVSPKVVPEQREASLFMDKEESGPSVKKLVTANQVTRLANQPMVKAKPNLAHHRSSAVMQNGLTLPLDYRIRELVESARFTVLCAAAVLLHTVFLAFDTDLELDQVPAPGPSSIAFGVDAFFTSFYTAEASLRAAGYRTQYLKSGWNVLDLGLIVLSLVDLGSVLFTSSSDPSLSVAPGLRLLRLLRLARLVRLLRFFKQLWLLAIGVVSSMRTVVWAWFLVGIIIYVFALFFTRTFSIHTCKDNPDELLYEYFGTFPRSIVSTFQVTTLEDWALLTEVGMSAEVWVGPMFVLLMMLTTWGVMQAIIAVFVNNALEASMVRSKDLAKKRKEEDEEVCRQLAVVFALADVDGNGVLSKAEFQQVIALPKVVQRLQEVGVDIASAESLFDILDIDGSKSLDGYEFVEGVFRSRGNAQNKDLLGLRCDCWRISLSVEEDLAKAAKFIEARVEATVERIESLRRETQGVLRRAAGQQKFRKERVALGAAASRVAAVQQRAEEGHPKGAPCDDLAAGADGSKEAEDLVEAFLETEEASRDALPGAVPSPHGAQATSGQGSCAVPLPNSTEIF